MRERKLFIVGPSASGKTYLAEKLAQKYKIPHLNLDYLFYKHVKDRSRIKVSENEWRRELEKILKKKGWIIEGVNPISEVILSSEKILYLRTSLQSAILNQWKRYFTNSKQRREHGFINNLKLSRYLVKQYLDKEDLLESDNLQYSRVAKLDRILKEHKSKLLTLKSRNEVNRFLSSLDR